jgi:hypothetical protein
MRSSYFSVLMLDDLLGQTSQQFRSLLLRLHTRIILTTLILTASMVGKVPSKIRRMAQFGKEINHSMAAVTVMVISGSDGQIKGHGREVISQTR